MKVALIFLGGTNMQNICFWPSYMNCISGYEHDLIFVHRNWHGVGPRFKDRNISTKLIIENKISSTGEDIPHKAFGAYRHYFNKYKSNYDMFVFISDDVVIRRDNWLKDIVTTILKSKKIGFGSSLILNEQRFRIHTHKLGIGKVCQVNHMKAPFWFATTESLSQTNWQFNSDHNGELRIADQITSVGFFGVQVGNKIDLAYDALDENSSGTQSLLEKMFFPEKKFLNKFELHELDYFTKQMKELTHEQIQNSEPLISNWSHIQPQNIYTDIEPFNGLIYRPSINIAKNNVELKEIYPGIYTL